VSLTSRLSTAIAALAFAVVVAPTPSATPQALDIITHGSRDRKAVALTFDADMTPGMLRRLRRGGVKSWYNAKIVEILRADAAAATIFATGLWAQTYPDVVRELARDRLFEIGNHGFSHAAFRVPCYGLRRAGNKRAEISETQEILRRLTGRAPVFFRFPGGCSSPEDVGLVRGYGLRVGGWDVTSGDAFSADAPAIVQRVLKATQNGSIIVMHLSDGPNAPVTGQALPFIVHGLRDRGFVFVTMSQLVMHP
jgi:peptidoglycan/xylan/chitin deacetylase (PgdA/CDA1 family)